jgi:hypothetical protein
MTCPLCAGRMSASAKPTLATTIECETCGYAVASTQYAVPAPTPLLRAQFARLSVRPSC